MKRGNILVIRGGAIGDFILTLPVFAALRAHFPNAHLEVLGYPHIAQLALAGGFVDAVRPIESRGLASFFVPNGPLPDELVRFFAGFDIVLSYLYDPDRVLQDNVLRCSPAQFIPGPPRPDETGGVHATQSLLRPLERLAIFDADPIPRLTVAGAAPAADRSQWLAIHPGSGSELKNWPEPSWVALLRLLADRTDRHLLIVGGEAEADRVQRLSRLWPADRLAVALNVPLVELARRLAQVEVFLGHDSGITHLAAALGLRGLALWGDTRSEVWAPLSDRWRILRGPSGLRRLTVEPVAEALLDLLAPDKRSESL